MSLRIKNVLQYLEMTAVRLPDKVAISDGAGGQSLTFSQLLDRAHRVGSELCRRTLTGKRVAILAERHPSTVALMLGVLYAGAVYVPLDTAQPKQRKQALLTQADVALLICDEANREEAKALNCPVCDARELERAEADHALLAAVRAAQIDTDPTYIIFTSGSTGTPKGVLGTHRAMIDYGEALTEALGFDEHSVFGCQSPLWYDAALKEILTVLMYGATAYLIPPRLFSFPVLLMRYLNENTINTVCWVSSALTNVCVLGALQAEPSKTLSCVVFGSEVLAPVHYRQWRAALPEARFFQLYGPTEATGMSCCFCADRDFGDDERIPIGRPLDNTGLMLIGEDGAQVLPVSGQTSAQGEIFLRGSCLTLGYDNDARTGEVFVQNPLHDRYPETVYRTGDLAYFNERGELVFVGRRDGQIKRMGHRVELGEIEAAAMRYPGVAQAVCVADGERQEIALAFLGEADGAQLLCALAEQLPRHMLPCRVRCVEALPRLSNGKIDRRTLAAQLFGE